jgi:hypothetical protein
MKAKPVKLLWKCSGRKFLPGSNPRINKDCSRSLFWIPSVEQGLDLASQKGLVQHRILEIDLLPKRYFDRVLIEGTEG